jgi:hypothetical protein
VPKTFFDLFISVGIALITMSYRIDRLAEGDGTCLANKKAAFVRTSTQQAR